MKFTQADLPEILIVEPDVHRDDRALAIDWPVNEPLLSEKDATGRNLADVSPSELPTFSPR